MLIFPPNIDVRPFQTLQFLFKETVINALKTERDVSVRQRAVDLLYAMCDRYTMLKHKIIYTSC